MSHTQSVSTEYAGRCMRRTEGGQERCHRGWRRQLHSKFSESLLYFVCIGAGDINALPYGLAEIGSRVISSNKPNKNP